MATYGRQRSKEIVSLGAQAVLANKTAFPHPSPPHHRSDGEGTGGMGGELLVAVLLGAGFHEFNELGVV